MLPFILSYVAFYPYIAMNFKYICLDLSLAFKWDISASLFVILGWLIIVYYICLSSYVFLFTLVAFLPIFISSCSLCCTRLTANDQKLVDCKCNHTIAFDIPLRLFGRGWLGVPFIHLIYLFISAGLQNGGSNAFAAILWHQAPVKMTSVLVLFLCHLQMLIGVQVSLHRFPLAALVAFPIIFCYALLHRGQLQSTTRRQFTVRTSVLY